ncbi:MAG: serine hydrolase domain-containing protein [Isosphaeraceae bacterium]|nr:serine hydrolase domain-containing protein [Isosphaeraceae bacterium]
MIERSVPRRNFRFTVAAVEQLEGRRLLSSGTGPFSASFRTSLRNFMRAQDLPQISISIHRGDASQGDSTRDDVGYQYWFTNRQYAFRGGRIPKTDENSLFRLASVSKVFTATAIMKQVELGNLALADRAFQVLGYFDAQGNPVAQSGFDPVTGAGVTYSPSPELYDVTIQSLLNMSSGLPLNVPIQSATFPKTPDGQVIYVQGSYASIAFAGPAPYSGPATADQQVAYYSYSFSTNDLELDSPGTYLYNDTGYLVLGAIAERVSKTAYDMDYGSFLDQYILSPIGISKPQEAPATATPMVGIARTLRARRFPTEVTYYTNATGPNIFPNAATHPNRVVSQAYGGFYYVESHFGEGGLAATPSALTRLFHRLGEVYSGLRSDGPLSRDTISQMVGQGNGVAVPNSGGAWWGLGWEVFPTTPNGSEPGNWSKNGALPGTSTLLTRLADGTTFAYTLNQRLSTTGSSSRQTPPANQLATIIRNAIAAWNNPKAARTARRR